MFLTHVWATVALFLEEDENGQSLISSSIPSQNLIMSAKDTELWRTPLRFSFFKKIKCNFFGGKQLVFF